MYCKITGIKLASAAFNNWDIKHPLARKGVLLSVAYNKLSLEELIGALLSFEFQSTKKELRAAALVNRALCEHLTVGKVKFILHGLASKHNLAAFGLVTPYDFATDELVNDARLVSHYIEYMENFGQSKKALAGAVIKDDKEAASIRKLSDDLQRLAHKDFDTFLSGMVKEVGKQEVFNKAQKKKLVDLLALDLPLPAKLAGYKVSDKMAAYIDAYKFEQGKGAF